VEYIKSGEFIGIREMKFEDCAKIVEWRNNERVRERYVYREEFTLEAQEKYFKEEVETGKVFQYMICELANNGRPIGSVVFKDYDPDERQIEYGLFIGEDDTIGKGYGKETALLSMKLGFEKFKVDRIISSIFCDNTASLLVNIKAGMKPYEVLNDVECTDGEIKDMIIVEAKKDEIQK